MATSEAAGVRLAIHSPTDFPFPDTFGYSAPVGFISSFGLKKHVIQKLSAPYGDCQREKKMNSSVYIYGGYDYNPEGCHRSCFQNILLNKCGCGDPRFPVPKGRTHCSAFNATARDCLEQVIVEFGDFHHITDNLMECQCKQPCEHEVFDVTFSASKWPSRSNDLGNCDPNMSDEECKKFYRENSAMVEVYYEQLNYELLKESEAYGLVNLLADVGGHLGLWMGTTAVLNCCFNKSSKLGPSLFYNELILHKSPHIKSTSSANLERLLDEVREMDVTQLDQQLTVEELCQQYGSRARSIKEKLMRLERYVGTLEKIKDKWVEHIQLVPKSKKKEEKYEEMANDDR
ncbi:unnamed protein product, partial [Acanthocheilonema viteae]